MGEPAGELTNPPFIWPANQSGFLPPWGQYCISPGKTKARDLGRGISFSSRFPGEELATSLEQLSLIPGTESGVYSFYESISLMMSTHVLWSHFTYSTNPDPVLGPPCRSHKPGVPILG